MTIDPNRQSKPCGICETEKPIEDFGCKASSRDGHDSVCKKCGKIQSALSALRKNGNFDHHIKTYELYIQRLKSLNSGCTVRQAAKLEVVQCGVV